MNLFHIYHSHFNNFAEKRLVFNGDKPKPAPAPAPGQAEKTDQESFEQRWARVQQEGEQELEAAIKRAEAQKKSGEKPTGPRATATIGEATYTDASGTHKLDTDQPKDKKSPGDKKAETLIADLDRMGEETVAALKAEGPAVGPADTLSEEAVANMDRAYQESQKPKPTLMDRIFRRKEKDDKDKPES